MRKENLWQAFKKRGGGGREREGKHLKQNDLEVSKKTLSKLTPSVL